VKKPKRLNIVIDPGMRPGETIVFSGDAHEEPGAQTGDVVIRLRQKPHKTFKRLRGGDDLYIEKNINLSEALGGFELKVPHLDGRTLVVKNNPNAKVIKPGMLSLNFIEQMGNSTPSGFFFFFFFVWWVLFECFL
jgi:DnaJ homolog subfamily A member 2